MINLKKSWKILKPINKKIITAYKIKDKRIFFGSYLFTNILAIVVGLIFKWNIFTPKFLSIPNIQEWIMAVPATAGSRAIMIGIALGIVTQTFKYSALYT